ncbi:MAG: hypothetical protein ACP5E3_15695 [Bacteroidales bacterium]
MKIKKQIRKRNKRIIFLVITTILLLILILNLQDFIDGIRDGAGAASHNF